MGLNFSTCDLLASADFFRELKKRTGSAHILTLGRQSVRLSRRQTLRIAKKIGISAKHLDLVISKNSGFCEGLLSYMGADKVQSLDYSDYEGADFLVNLNKDVIEDETSILQGQFDAVFDFGTSQMVFNPAKSLLNSLSFLKVGGILVLVLPVSGFVNHGMYQFGSHFFKAISNKKTLNTNIFYFERTRSARSTKVWDTLNPFFDFNHKYLMSFCIIEKVAEVSKDDFLENTQMLRYDSSSEEIRISQERPRRSFSFLKKLMLKFFKKTPLIKNICCWLLTLYQAKGTSDINFFEGFKRYD